LKISLKGNEQFKKACLLMLLPGYLVNEAFCVSLSTSFHHGSLQKWYRLFHFSHAALVNGGVE